MHINRQCHTLFLILLLITPFSIFAQWIPTSGPGGGSISFILASGKNLFAVSDLGLYRSGNGGDYWTSTNSFLGFGDKINCLAANDNYLFAGTKGGGAVWRSPNNGDTWQEVSEGLPGYDINFLEVNGTTLFAGTYDGLYLSQNNGNTWNKADNGIKNKNILSYALHGTDIFVGTGGTGVMADGTGIYRSSNNGDSWMQCKTGLINDGEISVINVNAKYIFIYGSNSGLLHSGDNGDSWVQDTIVFSDIRNIYAVGSNVFLGTSQGMYRSTNYGDSWIKSNTGLTNNDIRTITGSGTIIFAGTLGGGVFRSTNNGVSWTQVNNGLASALIMCLATKGSNLFAGTNGNGVYRTNDNGASWNQVNNGLNKLAVYTFAVNSLNLFAGTYNGEVYRSVNEGDSWTQVHLLPNIKLQSGAELTNGAVTALVLKDSNLFAGIYAQIPDGGKPGFGGVYRSINNGGSWTETLKAWPGFGVIALAVNGTYLFAGTNRGVYRSADNGDSWILVNNGLTNIDVTTIAVSGTYLLVSTASGVYRSIDHGDSWTRANLPFGVTGLTANSATLFAWNDGSYVFRSVNNGDSWTEVNGVFPKSGLKTISMMIVKGENIFAGIDGIWKCPISELTTDIRVAGGNWQKNGIGKIRASKLRIDSHIGFVVNSKPIGKQETYNAVGKRTQIKIGTAPTGLKSVDVSLDSLARRTH